MRVRAAIYNSASLDLATYCIVTNVNNRKPELRVFLNLGMSGDKSVH